jgi:hypothetical protein
MQLTVTEKSDESSIDKSIESSEEDVVLQHENTI